VLCFLCGTDWILKCYLDELRLQRFTHSCWGTQWLTGLINWPRVLRPLFDWSFWKLISATVLHPCTRHFLLCCKFLCALFICTSIDGRWSQVGSLFKLLAALRVTQKIVVGACMSGDVSFMCTPQSDLCHAHATMTQVLVNPFTSSLSFYWVPIKLVADHDGVAAALWFCVQGYPVRILVVPSWTFRDFAVSSGEYCDITVK
jgi:hypothetical protein